VARCPWVDSTCARCANESPDDPSASSRQGRWPVTCSLRHTRPNLPGRGTSPQRSQGVLSSQADDWTSGSPLEPTGGSEGVPPACVVSPPSSTTAQAYRHRAQKAGGERDGVAPGHRLERLRTHLCVNNSHRLLRGGLVGEWVVTTGLGGAVRQPGRRLRPSDETRERPQDSRLATALLSLSPSAHRLQPAPGLASCANQPGDVDPSPSQSSAQRWAAVVDAAVGAEPLHRVFRSHPVPLSSPLLGSMTVSPRRCRGGRCRHVSERNLLVPPVDPGRLQALSRLPAR